MQTLQTGKFRRLNIRNIILVLLFLYAGSAMASAFITKLSNTTTSVDFYAHWMPVQYLRQGLNPYIELDTVDYFQAHLRFPIQHVDGVTQAGQFNGIFGRPIPANTPLMLFTLYPLSFFNWSSVKIIWMLINIVIVIFIVRLSVRLIEPEESRGAAFDLPLLTILFFSFLPLRATFANGQTTGLVFLCMLLAVWFTGQGRKNVSGIFLGLALSKYTLGIAAVAYFVYKRQWRALFIAFAIQGIALLLLAVLTATDVLSTLTAYLALASPHADKEGIHLGYLIGASPMVGFILVSGIFGVVGMVVERASRHRTEREHDIWMFSLMILWALLAVYHRFYDLALLIFPLIVLVRGILPTNDGRYNRSQIADSPLRHPSGRWKIILFSIISVAFLLPSAVGIAVVSPGLVDFYNSIQWALGTLWAVVLTGVIVILSRETMTSPLSPLKFSRRQDTFNNRGF